MPERAQMKAIYPILPARKMEDALRFYIERLGFVLAFGDVAKGYVGLRRDGIEVHLQFQFEETLKWIPSAGISYHLGVDGVSLFLLGLNALLFLIAIAVVDPETPRLKQFVLLLLLLEAATAGILLAPASAFALLRRRFVLARFFAAGQVVLLLAGWALAQWPFLIYPDLSLQVRDLRIGGIQHLLCLQHVKLRGHAMTESQVRQLHGTLL